MFWAVFGYGIQSPLVAIDGEPDSALGGITARVYRDVLVEHLPTMMDQANCIFMHNNAPIHTAGIIKDWL